MPRDLSPPRRPRRPGGWTASISVLIGLIAPVVSGAGEGPEVSFRREPGRVRIEVGGEPLATYVYRDEVITRPYLTDVHAPGGTRLTRNHPPIEGKDPTDHATYHPGLWLAFGDLGGADGWRNRARVEHEGFVEEPAGGSGRGTFAVANRYLKEDGATICREVCRYGVLVRPSGTLLIASSEFRSDAADFAFGDQEEMGFGVRVATPLAVKQGGRLRNSDTLEGERKVWGEAADWCDYSGTVDGRHVGITLMPDPRNFRRSWFHARDYGLLVANPFGRAAFNKGEKSRVVVRRGEPFRLGFGVLLHGSPAGQEPDLAAAYGDYVDELGRGAPSPKGSTRVLSAVDFARRTIYHSPQTPGYTCWVGAWAMPDGSLMTCFTQATGPLNGRPRASKEVRDRLGWPPAKDPIGYDFTGLDLHNVYLRSRDLGETWDKVGADLFHTPGGQMSQGGGQIALRDGTILRAVFGFHLPLNPELPQTGYLQRSTDGARTWGKPEVLLDPSQHTYRITRMRRLRDGRLIATGGLARGIPAGTRDSMGYVEAWEPLLLVSSDEGTTWTPLLDVVPPEHRKGWSGEEWDTAELPNGDLVCVFRRHDSQSEKRRQVRWQGLLERRGTGWVMRRLGPSILPHSGHPDLLMTREGVVLHVATTGAHWTDDGGLTWNPLRFPGLPKPYRSGYYPHALQLEDGRIRVFAHRGAHDPYGRDQEVLMDTFRLEESGR